MPQSADQFSGIFICYRRDDSAGHAGRLYDRLATHFGPEQIFMDLDRIEPGEDFVHVIERAVGSCEILLALVGRSWLTSQDEAGRRLDNPSDFVRVEIAAAFERDVRVIPVLVQGARMPRAQDLPEALRPLSRRQAFDLSDQRWRQDVEQLVGTLERILARRREARHVAAQEEEEEQQRREAEALRQSEEDERLKQAAAEAERLKRKAEEAERLRREAEERERRAMPDGEVRDAPPVSQQSPTSAARPPVVIIAVVCAVGFAVVWSLVSWMKGAQVAVNRNATPAETPRPGQTETPSPTAETPLSPSPEMVYVPGGKFTMGRDDSDEYERPAHEVTVGPFFIDTYEVTRMEYKKCVADRQCPVPQGWADGTYPERTERQPVTGVDWDAADAYVKWRSMRDRITYRLPTEEEWEFAARGTDGRRYPWGEEWLAGLANADGASKQMADVGEYKGASPFGALDMAGNAWEWTATDLRAYRKGTRRGRLPVKTAGLKVIRGCMYGCDKAQATTTYRRGWPASGDYDYGNTGFRCAKDAGN